MPLPTHHPPQRNHFLAFGVLAWKRGHRSQGLPRITVYARMSGPHTVRLAKVHSEFDYTTAGTLFEPLQILAGLASGLVNC